MELILIIILIYSIILHEISHAYIAYKLGDSTAKYEGRITLNPIPHIDPIGTLALPLISFYISGFIFGWAKPVPYNPYNLKNPAKDSIIIAFAGPIINIFLALIFVFLYKVSNFIFLSSYQDIFLDGLRINLILAFFNLLPIPPLDGSKIFLTKIPIESFHLLEMYGFIFLILFIFIFSSYFMGFINFIQNFLLSIF